MTINRIITRGMGPSRGLPGRAGIVTQGYGNEVPQVVIDVVETIRRQALGGKVSLGKIEHIEEFIVWAKLVDVNGDLPENKIEGSITVKMNQMQTSIKEAKIHAKKITETIRTYVKRIK